MSALQDTRRSLHAVAEFLLAGPQFRASATIRLRARAGGFATVAEPDVRVEMGELVAGDVRVTIAGASLSSLAEATGLDGGRPDGVYGDGAGVAPDDLLSIDVAAAARIAETYSVGDAALRSFAPDVEPVLWPEHFDIAVRVEEVNYGISPGDGYLDEPYAYIGIDQVPDAQSWPDAQWWNAPFGASRPLAELSGADAVLAFFTDGRAQVQRPAERIS